MTPLHILIDDLRAWKRLSFTGGEWAMLYGFTAGVVPAVSGVLAMLGFHLLVSIIEHRFDLAGLPFMLVFSGLFTLLYGFIPASTAFILLRVLAAALKYVNLQLTLIVAGLGTAIAAFLILGFLHPIAIAVIIATLIVTTTLWALLRARGLGSAPPPADENPAPLPPVTPG